MDRTLHALVVDDEQPVRDTDLRRTDLVAKGDTTV